MITISIDSGETRNLLNQFRRSVDRPRDLLENSARAVTRKLKLHFAARDREGNKLGGRKTHFWGDIGKSTNLGPVDDHQASVIISDFRFAQKLHGGTITAKTPWPGSGFLLLTIPVKPEAYARKVSVTRRETGLSLFFVGNAAGGVIASRAEGSKDLNVFYACVPSVTQAADPRALPPGEELETAAVEAAQSYMTTKIQESQTR